MAASLNPFTIRLDNRNNDNTLTIPACQWVDVRVLAANVAETHTLPTHANVVNFSATGNFYVNFTTTATVPAADVTDGTGSCLNPGVRDVSQITSFSIIAPAAIVVTMEFYS